MKPSRDEIFRCAQRVQQFLANHARDSSNRLARQLASLSQQCETVSGYCQQIRLADRRGWSLAGDRLRGQIGYDVQQVKDAAVELLRSQGDAIAPVPGLLLLVEELRELRVEFDEVAFDLSENRIAAQTEPLVLEEVHLGPFSIELHLDRLSGEPGSDCFECIAIEPNPAENNSAVTHPHVQDGGLCAGEATLPIRLALTQGRLFDAFVLVAGVLRTYNAQSPYVSLDHWNGSPCPECGDSCDEDDTRYCESCDRYLCESCSGCCEACDTSCCCSCLERDPVSGTSCCPSCRQICRTCERVVDPDSFDSETELCPQCLAKQEAEQPNNPEDIPDDATTLPTPIPQSVSAA